MGIRVETEQIDRVKDRKVAGISAFAAFALLLALLGFIGYHISNPALPKPLTSSEVSYIPLDAQLPEQAGKGSHTGTPAKTKQAAETPAQMERILAQQSSISHVKPGNSDMSNTRTPNNNPSGAKHVSDKPFGTGGINDGNKFGNKIGDDQSKDDSNFKSGEETRRYLVKQPNTNTLQSDENCKIVLSVLVDPNGLIVGSPTFVKNSSTTNDMTLVSQVSTIVKNQAQFNKVNTTKNTKEAIVIRITAS
jgi:hypothetical protein